ncbi:MAG: hypothetical protein KF741_09130 [Ferruginibacter sp.]|nr:hypothetical protein [Ferruginibacter sp.]
MPRLKKRGMYDCLSKELYSSIAYSNPAIKQPGSDYFLVESGVAAADESVVAGAVAVESVVAGTGASTFVESAVGSGVSPELLQAAKDTDTIAKAKITFFILCFV